MKRCILLLLFLLIPTVSYSSPIDLKEEIRCMADNIYHEARNQGVLGWIAVGNVVLNRRNHPKFPFTICNVVKQGLMHPSGHPKINMCQFSWYCDGISDRVDRNSRVYSEILKVSKHIITNFTHDFTRGALYYHAKTVNPYWAAVFKKTRTIGDHVFYKPEK